MPARNRKTMRAERLGERAQPICHTQKKTLPQVNTRRLPYISDRGAKNNGPMTYPSTNMLTVRELRISEVLWKVASMKLTPGANIEEASGEMKVILPSRAIRIHLRVSGKLKGISGSSCDSHPTRSLSRSDNGRGGGGRRAFLLLVARFVVIRDNLLLVLVFVLIRSMPFSFISLRVLASKDLVV